METVRPCGCKGIRTCLICEEEYKIFKSNPFEELRKLPSYVYCPECDQAWPGWDINIYKEHPNHTGNPIYYSGVYIQLNFLSEKETNNLITDIDNLPWDISQSGRRKQNYGPKCNFKKRRLSLGNFNGFPITTKFIQKKLSQVPILKEFKTIEQCSLEYTPERGASIDPHIDDCWIWGERIVTVNVTGDSVLTMSPYQGSTARYNLDHASTYSSVVPQMYCNGKNVEKVPENAVIRLPMPAKSLIVLYGNARYNWEHAVLREDIQNRRICIAYREFTPPYLPRGLHSDKTEEILMKAQNFW